MNSEQGCNLTLIDPKGTPLIVSQDLDNFPDDTAITFIKSSDLQRVSDLTGDIFKGYINVPNRTVELLFKPEIKKGLDSGAYSMMKTKTGEMLADVVDKNKIVGKARVVDGGRLKQLASGSFQLLSIIVAQSHLEDIDRTLNGLKSSVDGLHTIMANDKLSKILGRIDYLQGVVDKLNKGDFESVTSQQIKNKIEDTVADANEWQQSIFLDLTSLINAIDKQQDQDRFGTGDTYKTLRQLIEDVKPLIQRRKMMLWLASLLNNLGVCLDPTTKEFSQFKIKSEEWGYLLDKFLDVSSNRVRDLLKSSKFNSNEIVELRRDKILEIALFEINIAKYDQAKFDINHLRMKNDLKKIVSGSGKFRLAVSFDDQGQVVKAAVVD